MNSVVNGVTQITPRELKSRLDAGEILQLIDVREPFERNICDIGGDLIPKDTIVEKVDSIRRDIPVVIYCRSGGRSGFVVKDLQQRFGLTNLINLDGGILRWADDVDTTITKY